MNEDNIQPKKAKYDVLQQLWQCSHSNLKFSDDFKSTDFRLIEVDDELMNKIKSGERIQLVGDPKADAVLCTSSSTFSVKKVETSNSIYLVQQSNSINFEISAKCEDYYELTRITPNSHQLEILLHPTIYHGMEYEKEHPVDPSMLVRKSDLQSKIQASEIERNDLLKQLNVIEFFNGSIRMISKKLLYTFLSDLINAIIAHRWDIHHLSQSDIMKELQLNFDEDCQILEHVLGSVGQRNSKALNYWILDSLLVCKSVAHILFLERYYLKQPYQPVQGKFPLKMDVLWPVDDFMSTWAIRVPSGCVPDKSLLEGIAIMERNTILPSFLYLPADSLSRDIKERMINLFTVREKYSLEEITPYLIDIVHQSTGSSKSVTSLLLQHARLVDGFYFSK